MMLPRGTQEQFIDKCVTALKSKSTKKCVAVAPVAYGKSLCIAQIVSKLDSPVIILQPNKELLQQNYLKFVSYGSKATVCCQSLKLFQKNRTSYTVIDGKEMPCKVLSEITYATTGSVTSMAADIKALGVKYMIIDECHLSTSTKSVLRKLMEATGIKNILGVTATPVILTSSMEGSYIKMLTSTSKNLFSTIIHVVQVSEMVESKYWSKLAYEIKDVDTKNLKYNTSGAEYSDKTIEEHYIHNKLHDRAVKKVKLLRAQGKKSILIFAPNIATARHLTANINGSEFIHGKTKPKERAEIINRFKTLETDVLINVEILTAGFDHPQLDTLIMLRPTASIGFYYQILGRITRIHPDKKYGLVVDYSGNVHRFGKIENLNYEYIDGYGWGMFSKDKLLTGVPIKMDNKPTKDTIKKSVTIEGSKSIKDHGRTKIWFGKHAGTELQHVPSRYLAFILENFDFGNQRMLSLKNSIQIILKLK